MSLPESARLRTRLDALTWRLQEATTEMERFQGEAEAVDRSLRDLQVATLLGEEAPGDIEDAAARSEAVQWRLAREESLVQRLQARRVETSHHYRRALSTEFARRVAQRWQQLMDEGP